MRWRTPTKIDPTQLLDLTEADEIIRDYRNGEFSRAELRKRLLLEANVPADALEDAVADADNGPVSSSQD
jgi:hypothetical protein